MSKVGGLQFSRPVFDWESKDKLTELSQFKADCEILFTGPLCDLKEKQRAGLLINWLGRQATQIIASSTDNNVDSPEAVFEILEKVFRPESNQTLSRFKFRNMKQTSAQSCDSYMSQLRLSLPECRYRNDSDELLKDQFIFGLYNKEIQDHLLGEISETDNSVKALYEARRIESKLAQRKMLGIVTPTAISVEAIHRGFRNKSKSKSKGFKNLKQITQTVDSVASLMIKGNVLLTVKFAIIVAVKIILSQNANLRPDLTQTGQEGLSLENVASVAITKRSTV